MTRTYFTAFCLVLLLGVHLAFGTLSGATPALQNRNLGSRVVGGTKASQKRFPYYTYIVIGAADGNKKCGGSLIARDVVLTAAHCLVAEYSNITDVDVWVNSSTAKYSEYEYYRTARRLVVHRLYKPSTLRNDIGLIFLDKPVKGVPLVKMNRNASFPGSVNPPSLNAIGLGATGYNESTWSYTFPQVLMQTSLKSLSMLACKKVYGSSKTGESTICAGGDGVKGVCFGDSGGPLLVKKSSASNDVQVGITSNGPGGSCVALGEPDIYTRVSYYAKWVDTQRCKYSKYKPSSCPS